MKFMVPKVILAILIGVILTVVSLTYRQPFADPSMHCDNTSGDIASGADWLIEQSWLNDPNYYAEGYPFTARQEPTETSCDTVQYRWEGVAGDLFFWSLAGYLVSSVCFPLFGRLGHRRPRTR